MIRRGPRTCSLTPDQIKRLQAWQFQKDYSIYALNQAMDGPWTYRTLVKAMEGRPVLDRYHAMMVAWIDRHSPRPDAAPAGLDRKSAAAGERE